MATASVAPAAPAPPAPATAMQHSWTDVELPPRVSRHGYAPSDCFALVLDDVLTREECDALAARGRPRAQYVRTAKHVVDGREYTVDIQNPRRYKVALVEDGVVTARIWERLNARMAPALDTFVKQTRCGAPRGLNPRLRVLRYTDDDQFEPHFDQVVHDDTTGATSLLTVLIYLNDGGGVEFSGGETRFLDSRNPTKGPVPVVPKAGRVLVFDHDLYHCGVRLAEGEAGAKEIVRTEIMFDADKVAAYLDTAGYVAESIRPVAVDAGDSDGDGGSDGSGADAASSGAGSAAGDSSSAGSSGGDPSEPPTSSAPLLKPVVAADDEPLTVADVLDRTKLRHLEPVLDELDMMVSLEALRVPGEAILTAMLVDLGVKEEEVATFVTAAFEDS